eukprot:14886372-Heterocapsa_arctica.AAC.1
MTEDIVKNMVNVVTENMMNKMGSVEQKTGEIEVTQEATKQIMHMGFKDTERSILAEHDYIRDIFTNIEDDIGRVKYLVKDLGNKRKNSE